MNALNLRDIRKSWLLHGNLPAGNLEAALGGTVYRSWQRCLQSGLEAYQKCVPDNILDGDILKSRIEQRHELIALAKPTMNYLHGLMLGSGGVILLSDHQGVIVHAVGDSQFVSKADRVLLKTGASWLEKHRGTNAIGTALIERAAVSVNGSEHFLEGNGFLSCTAAPIFKPDGMIGGVLDISTDKNAYHPHTTGLVKATVHSLEKQLFAAKQSQYALVLKVHGTPEGIGSMGEGVIGLDEAGLVIGIDRVALSLLEINAIDIGQVKISQLIELSLSQLYDCAKKNAVKIYKSKTHHFKPFFFTVSQNISYRPSFCAETAAASESSGDADFESRDLKQFSKLAIQKTLEKTNGNISLAAKLLGISRNTLYRYIKN